MASNLIYRPTEVPPGYAIAALFDTQAVVQGQNVTQFFSDKNPSSVDTENNYISMPFERKYQINGIGIELLVPNIVTTADINPSKVYACLIDCVVVLRAVTGKRAIAVLPGSAVFNTAATRYEYAGEVTEGADLAGKDRSAIFTPGLSIQRLAEPYEVEPGEQFYVEIIWKRPQDLPAAAHWLAAGYADGFRLRCVLDGLTRQ